MTRIVASAGPLIAAALFATAAFAQAGHPGHGAMPGMAPAAADSPSTRAYKAADAAMMKAMAVPYTGDPDVDFRLHMIPHHEGAVAMAKVALAHAKDLDTKTMAEGIIRDQEREIGAMRAWLKAHGR